MKKYEIEIDPALLTRNGREYEPVAVRVPKDGDSYLSAQGTINKSTDDEEVDFPSLILRPKAWRPKEGERVLILDTINGEFGLFEEGWFNSDYGDARIKNGMVWPLSRRAEAEACIKRVKKAIGGEA